jgi:hypothetical protein
LVAAAHYSCCTLAQLNVEAWTASALLLFSSIFLAKWHSEFVCAAPAAVQDSLHLSQLLLQLPCQHKASSLADAQKALTLLRHFAYIPGAILRLPVWACFAQFHFLVATPVWLLMLTAGRRQYLVSWWIRPCCIFAVRVAPKVIALACVLLMPDAPLSSYLTIYLKSEVFLELWAAWQLPFVWRTQLFMFGSDLLATVALCAAVSVRDPLLSDIMAASSFRCILGTAVGLFLSSRMQAQLRRTLHPEVHAHPAFQGSLLRLLLLAQARKVVAWLHAQLNAPDNVAQLASMPAPQDAKPLSQLPDASQSGWIKDTSQAPSAGDALKTGLCAQCDRQTEGQPSAPA